MLSKALMLFVLAVVPAGPARLELNGWRSDLHLLASTIFAKHAAPFHHVSRAQFDKEVQALDRRLPDLDADAYFVGLDVLLNSIGDGHTAMRPPADSPHFGVEFRRFGGAYRLIAADPQSAAASDLGLVLTAVDGLPIADVHRRLLNLTPADETQPLREVRAEALLDNGVMLHGMQIGPRSIVQYKFRDNQGAAKIVTLSATSETGREGWVRIPRHPAVSQVESSEPIACSLLRQQSALYCDFRAYAGLERASTRMLQLLGARNAGRLIIDMRENGGGNFCDGLKYIVKPIAADEAINRKGHLFVLIGPRTFSAAMSNAVHFRQLTNAILVGQPIGEKPNSYQEADEITLPHTGWVGRYSTRLYRFGAGRENLIRPDTFIHATWDDFRNGRDAVLAYALRYRNHGAAGAKATQVQRPAESQYCS